MSWYSTLSYISASSNNSTDEQNRNDLGTPFFKLELMNGNFTRPAPSSTFVLGSSIPIRAEVELQTQKPMLLFLKECIAAVAADLDRSSQVRPVITNAGCLVESKVGNSKFLPRRKPSEIRLSLQAFKFVFGENIFLHCKLAAWFASTFTVDKKACHYLMETERWELADDPIQSDLCSCCDTFCIQRDRGSLKLGILFGFQTF
ncbi:uncharacterized protein LOC115806992 [Chanos chanos]|uniref:Uncharacterized protein LOC115806992 n=1 Tax=Chanos chanos TaxID=29144 RepID=A0A6J2UTA7_CHACN|nr:uncharacterized protein LOC115806992 [Chanos chanos]